MRRSVVYYHTERGESPVQEFLDSLSVKEQAKCLAYIEFLRDIQTRLPASVAKKVEEELWELRPEFGGTEFRFFYFLFLQDAVVLVHAVKKKTQQLKRSDIDLALTRARQHQQEPRQDAANRQNDET